MQWQLRAQLCRLDRQAELRIGDHTVDCCCLGLGWNLVGFLHNSNRKPSPDLGDEKGERGNQTLCNTLVCLCVWESEEEVKGRNQIDSNGCNFHHPSPHTHSFRFFSNTNDHTSHPVHQTPIINDEHPTAFRISHFAASFSCSHHITHTHTHTHDHLLGTWTQAKPIPFHCIPLSDPLARSRGTFLSGRTAASPPPFPPSSFDSTSWCAQLNRP